MVSRRKTEIWGRDPKCGPNADVGAFVRANRAHAEVVGYPSVVLSAKQGLLAPLVAPLGAAPRSGSIYGDGRCPPSN